MFCESLRKDSVEIINFKKKKMKLLTHKQQNSYENVCYIYKEKFEENMLKIKKLFKLGIIVIIKGNAKVQHIAYVI